MDRAVIIGAFQFLGFHFCRSLLDLGFEVVGVRSENEEKDAHLIEKRMEIGRNANFSEINMSELLSQVELHAQTLILIDYYSFSAAGQRVLSKEDHVLERFIINNKQKIAETDTRIISLLPVQWLHQKNKNIQHILENEIISHRIFLPTIYGPWQPNSFLFQQYLMKLSNPDRELSIHDCEWVHDTLYIGDIVEPILKLAETTSADAYTLKSDIPHYWKKCAEYLSIPADVLEMIPNKDAPERSEIKIKTVKNRTLFSEGIENQKRHLKMIDDGGIY
ncbi:hypothetical protein [Bacillus sp. FJAT-29937]|uniref:hypothetical protein n=1 Tax=Bacillus sp. FJAT-29937 TaxID=1720553 RepID=UPI00083158DD|nr:hypothetical protein [Bacillus sp. FJAT-29937]